MKYFIIGDKNTGTDKLALELSEYYGINIFHILSGAVTENLFCQKAAAAVVYGKIIGFDRFIVGGHFGIEFRIVIPRFCIDVKNAESRAVAEVY